MLEHIFDTPEESAIDCFGVPRPGSATASRGSTPTGTATGTATGALSPTVQALVDAVGAVVDQEAWRQPGSQALADARAVLAQVERLRGASLGRLADVERRGLYVEDGAASIGAWVAQQQSSLDRGEVALSRRLAGFEQLDRAVRDGVLCIASAELVARALGRLRRHVDRPDGLIDGQDGEQAVTAVVVDGVRTMVCEALGGLGDDDPRLLALIADLDAVAHPPWLPSQLHRLEAAFVLLAGRVETGLLSRALGMLVDALLPNQLEDRAEDAHTNRGFSIKLKADGSGWSVPRGDLDLECGELLDTVLKAAMATDPDNPVDTAGFQGLREQGWQPGDDLPGCGGPRSLPQRRHDALKLALRTLLDSAALGVRDKVAPHVAVTVGIDALHEAPGALPPVAGSGARLPHSLVRRWWCDSAVTRFVLDWAVGSWTSATPTARSQRMNAASSITRPADGAKEPAARADRAIG